MGKIVGGRVKADDQAVCYSAVWTKYEREQLIGVAIGQRMPNCHGLCST